jgi:hypothetical protein
MVGAMTAAALVALAAAPAAAEHDRSASSGPAVDLNLDLKVGRDGFRLGGQLFGAGGVWGAWLNGERRPGGFTFDGRLQDPARAFNFTMNAEILDWLLGVSPGTGRDAPRGVDQL